MVGDRFIAGRLRRARRDHTRWGQSPPLIAKKEPAAAACCKPSVQRCVDRCVYRDDATAQWFAGQRRCHPGTCFACSSGNSKSQACVLSASWSPPAANRGTEPPRLSPTLEPISLSSVAGVIRPSLIRNARFQLTGRLVPRSITSNVVSGGDSGRVRQRRRQVALLIRIDGAGRGADRLGCILFCPPRRVQTHEGGLRSICRRARESERCPTSHDRRIMIGMGTVIFRRLDRQCKVR